MNYHRRMMQRHLLLLWFLLWGWSVSGALAASPALSLASMPPFDVMRAALHQALHLRFPQAMETTSRLQEDGKATFESHLTAGIIAYFRARWQTPTESSVGQTGHELLTEVLEAGQKQLAHTPREPRLLLVLGLAAIFDALLQQNQASGVYMPLFTQGQTWLQQALIAHEQVTDAHLGLGLMYFAGTGLPSWLQRVAGTVNSSSSENAIHHLRRAAEAGHFSQDISRTFLADILFREKKHTEAVALGQALQTAYPWNGYYALLTGRSQYAHGQYAPCVETLSHLAAQLTETPSILAHREARFDLYYTWGKALQETQQYALAFEAFRKAINQDPQTAKDESLWAKYYLATLYERRGATKTARQFYRTLLRGRNVETLHRQVEKRLARLQ